MEATEKTTLALSRKPGESIRIGPDVLVQVVWVRGNKVRLTITAPTDVRILRSEIEEKFPFEKG